MVDLENSQSLSGANHVHDEHHRLTRGEILLRAEKVVKGFPGMWENLILDELGFDVKSGEIHVAMRGDRAAQDFGSRWKRHRTELDAIADSESIDYRTSA
jgi:hypothetical protein